MNLFLSLLLLVALACAGDLPAPTLKLDFDIKYYKDLGISSPDPFQATNVQPE